MRLIIGVNDLATIKPDLSKQWHPIKNGNLKPQQVTAGSSKKVWWKCELGHEWCAAVYSRSNGSGCPVCSGLRTLEGGNDLATIKPDLAKQWHPIKNGNLKPEQVAAHSNKKVWWKCELGHEWCAMVANRSKSSGCPVCSPRARRTLEGVNDLATIKPDLSKQWHPIKNGNLKPQQVTAGSSKKVWWKCELGHEWCAAVYSRSNGSGCPVCSSRGRRKKLQHDYVFHGEFRTL